MRNTCINTIFELAKVDKKVVFVGSDLGVGVLNKFKEKFPNRFFMEGISEQYITGMVAGLAKEGLKPFFNTIATFLTRRNFEQNMIDLGLHNLPVRLIGNGGGLAYAHLGPTHQAIEDISIMRAIPNMTILAPCDAYEMKNIMWQLNKIKGPAYIRLAKGGDKILTKSKKKITLGKSILIGNPSDVLFVTTGITTQECFETIKELKKFGINAGVLHNHSVKPFDTKNLIKACKKSKKIYTVEEHLISGGLGSIVLEELNNNKSKDVIKVQRIGIQNKFIKKYGSQKDLLNYCGISSKKILKKVLIDHGK